MALAFAVAASANLPTILYSLFWKRFNTRGAVWSIYGGLISSIGLIVFSPVVSGKVDAETGASAVDDHGHERSTSTGSRWTTRGSSPIPLAFVLGWLGTITSREAADPAKFAEMEVRSLTGAGAEKAVSH